MSPFSNKTKLSAWTIVFYLWLGSFTAFTGWIWHGQRDTINDLKQTKADIGSLKETNCGLVKFLTTARAARIRASKEETGSARENDINAARGYTALINQFKTVNCE